MFNFLVASLIITCGTLFVMLSTMYLATRKAKRATYGKETNVFVNV